MFYAMFNLSCIYLITKEYYKLGEMYLNIANLLKQEIIETGIIDETDPESTFNKCVGYYLEALKVLPEKCDIYINLIQLFRKIEKYDKALEYVYKVIPLDNTNYKAYLESGYIYKQKNDVKNAEIFFRISLMLNPNLSEIYVTYTEILRAQNKNEEALEIFEAALTVFPDEMSLLNNYSDCLLQQNYKNRAKEVLLYAYRLNNQEVDVNCNLAKIYRKEWDFDRAIEHILRAKEACPNNHNIYFILSSIYKDNELWDYAISALLKANELSPQNSIILSSLADCYKKTENYFTCSEICQSILSNNPNIVEAFVIFCEYKLLVSDWENIDTCKYNINQIANYCKNNSKDNPLSALISDYMIHDLSLKQWVCSNLTVNDCEKITDSENNIFFEDENIQNRVAQTGSLKIAYLVEDVQDEYTYLTLCQLIELHSTVNNIYIIIYDYNNIKSEDDDDSSSTENILNESDVDENILGNTPHTNYGKKSNVNNSSNHDWRKSIESNIRFINLSNLEDPKLKAENIFKENIDILIFLEKLCCKYYDNINIAKIYKTLSLKPVPIQMVLPFNGCTKNEKIFQFIILDNIIRTNKVREFFKEKLIILEYSSPFFCFNPKISKPIHTPRHIITQWESVYAGLENNNLDETVTHFPKDKIILANFSESYKINEELFMTWCEILVNVQNSLLVLKFCSDIACENLRKYGMQHNLSPDRFMFVKIDAKNYSFRYVNDIDLYLDVGTVNGSDEIFFCLFKEIEVITLIDNKYPITSHLSASILNRKNRSKKIIFDNYADYRNYVINLFNMQSSNNLQIENKFDKKKNKSNITFNCKDYSPIEEFVKSMDKVFNIIKMNKGIENICEILV